MHPSEKFKDLHFDGVTPSDLLLNPDIESSAKVFYAIVRNLTKVVGYCYAKNKYLAFKVLKSLIPDLINPKYNHYKFKLICDDLGLANLIFRSREDLTVVGIVDLE